MCFSPEVSIATAFFEFFVASFMLCFFRRTVLVRFFSVFVYLLGFYQFTEFMLCISGSFVWPVLGFIIYSFLPAIALNFVLVYSRRKFSLFSVYFVPVLFSIFSLRQNFVLDAYCSTVFVVVRTQLSGFLFVLYAFYYFGFIAFACLLSLKYYLRTRDFVFLISVLTAFVTTLLPVLLLFVFPVVGIMFPSVYCEFAVLFSVLALVCAYYEKRKK